MSIIGFDTQRVFTNLGPMPDIFGIGSSFYVLIISTRVIKSCTFPPFWLAARPLPSP